MYHGIQRALCPIQGDSVSPRQHTDSRNVIDVLMCDQNALHVIAGQIDLVQPVLNAFSTDTRINQDMCTVRSHTDAVSAASAGNTV
jgi:hypothetical protein